MSTVTTTTDRTGSSIARQYATLSAEEAPLFGLPAEEFYMLFCENDVTGARTTRFSQDKALFDMIVGAPDSVRSGLEVAGGAFSMVRAGWPDEWTLTKPNSSRRDSFGRTG